MQSIMGSLTSYERLKISQRTQEGRLRSIRNGGRPRGVNLIGYDWNPTSNQFVIHKEQAALVGAVFRLAAYEGMRPFRISRNLKARWLRGGRKTYIFDSTIADMLRRDCFVTGQYYPEPDGMPDFVHNVPPLVDRGTWELAQQNLAGSGRKAPSRQAKYAFLLRSIALCTYCGRKMRAQHTAGRYPYYRCRGGVSAPLNQPQYNARRGMRADHVDEAVWHKVVAILTEPGALVAEVTRALESEGVSLEALQQEVLRLHAHLRELHTKLERLVDAVADGLLPVEAIQKRRTGIDEARKTLVRRLERSEVQLGRVRGTTARLALYGTQSSVT